VVVRALTEAADPDAVGSELARRLVGADPDPIAALG
jgi:hypothetical protein